METLEVMAALARQAADSEAFRESVKIHADYRTWSLDLLDIWVRGHFHYRPEREEVVRTPAYMWESWQRLGFFEGDCDDVSTMFAAILRALGYRVRFVAIRYDKDPEFKHVYIEAFNGSMWVVLDPTVEQGTLYSEVERIQEAV